MFDSQTDYGGRTPRLPGDRNRVNTDGFSVLVNVPLSTNLDLQYAL